MLNTYRNYLFQNINLISHQQGYLDITFQTIKLFSKESFNFSLASSMTLTILGFIPLLDLHLQWWTIRCPYQNFLFQGISEQFKIFIPSLVTLKVLEALLGPLHLKSFTMAMILWFCINIWMWRSCPQNRCRDCLHSTKTISCGVL